MTATRNQAKDAFHGIADILVDDTLMTGNMQFAKAEERMHSNYDMGQPQTITNGSQIKIGEVQIGRDPDGTLRISQQTYIENLSNIKENCTTISLLYAQRAAKCPGSLHGPVSMHPLLWEDLAR
jgi:hypothetical protein